MKIALLGDTHLGIKSFSLSFLENQLLFLENQFIPELLSKGIKTVIQLGDIFDNRKVIDINFLNIIMERFFELFKKNGITLYILVGNHDIYFKNTRKINLLNFIQNENIKIINEKSEITLGDYKIKAIPWILPDEKITLEDIENYNLVLGHFEIKDFEVTRGFKADKGINPDFFKSTKKIKNVISGHYHLKNTNGLITYIGTPYQLTWNDYGAKNGYILYNLKDDTYEFIENKLSKKHAKFIYDDSNDKKLLVQGLSEDDLMFNSVNEIPKELLKNIIIKFIVNSSEDKLFEQELFLLKEMNIEFVLVDNSKLNEIITTAEETNMINDPLDFIMDKIQDYPHLIDKTKKLLMEAKSYKY